MIVVLSFITSDSFLFFFFFFQAEDGIRDLTVTGVQTCALPISSFWLDFWSIWPDKIDLQDAWRRTLRAFARPAPPPRKFAKYPLENKLYHLEIGRASCRERV